MVCGDSERSSGGREFHNLTWLVIVEVVGQRSRMFAL